MLKEGYRRQDPSWPVMLSPNIGSLPEMLSHKIQKFAKDVHNVKPSHWPVMLVPNIGSLPLNWGILD